MDPIYNDLIASKELKTDWGDWFVCLHASMQIATKQYYQLPFLKSFNQVEDYNETTTSLI